MVATSGQPRRRHLERESGLGRRSLGEGGFTLVEFMIAALITTIVLGGTVALATQIQQGYSTQLEDAAVEQEARYALDWIARDLRSAGSLPYEIIPTPQGVLLDPDGGVDDYDSIRIQADINPPDGDIFDGDENVTIAFDAEKNVITRQDSNDPANPLPVEMTDSIFTGLQFTYLNASGAATGNPDLVASIRVQVKARSRAIRRAAPMSPTMEQYATSTFATDVRLRTR